MSNFMGKKSKNTVRKIRSSLISILTAAVSSIKARSETEEHRSRARRKNIPKQTLQQPITSNSQTQVFQSRSFLFLFFLRLFRLIRTTYHKGSLQYQQNLPLHKKTRPQVAILKTNVRFVKMPILISYRVGVCACARNPGPGYSQGIIHLERAHVLHTVGNVSPRSELHVFVLTFNVKTLCG